MRTQLSDLNHSERLSVVCGLSRHPPRPSANALPCSFRRAPSPVFLLIFVLTLSYIILRLPTPTPHFTSLYGTLFLPYLVLAFLFLSLSLYVACFLSCIQSMSQTH